MNSYVTDAKKGPSLRYLYKENLFAISTIVQPIHCVVRVGILYYRPQLCLQGGFTEEGRSKGRWKCVGGSDLLTGRFVKVVIRPFTTYESYIVPK